MLKNRPNHDLIEKLKRFSTIYDRIFVLFSGSLWILSTLWDIYKLQRYWLDYTAEIYGCFFLFYMMLFSLNPKLLPIKIYNSFSLITTVRGRGTLLLIISSLFLKDNHIFHRFCAVLLFIGGILYHIWEFLIPTTREELTQIEAIYANSSNKNNKMEIKVNNNINFDTNKSISVFDKSNAIMNNMQNEIKLDSEPNNPNNIDNASNNHFKEEEKAKEEVLDNKNESNESNENNKNILVDDIITKTDNPYEIPDDF